MYVEMNFCRRVCVALIADLDTASVAVSEPGKIKVHKLAVRSYQRCGFKSDYPQVSKHRGTFPSLAN